MAEPQGISRTFQDIGRTLANLYQGVQGVRGEVGRNIGNVGRFFASQAPVQGSSGLTPAMQAAADRQAAEIARMGGRGALDAAMQKGMAEAPTQLRPTPSTTPGGMGGPAAAPVNPLAAIFNPMFESLNQREEAANKRYEANKEQVTNIYGQITGARTADIATTGEAFQRLTDAASARSAAVNTQIDESEAARLRNNQAALESMGIGGLSTSQGDIASQGAAMAKNTNTLNAENWRGLLTAMGVNAQDIARSDVAGFNYRMGEDLGKLRGAREEFAQNIGQERTNLVSQQAQATFDFQQAQQRAAAASAAAAQRAAQDQADAANKQFAEALKASGPLLYTVSNLMQTGGLSTNEGTNVMNIITDWTQNVESQGNQKWTGNSAARSILQAAGDTLSQAERNAILSVTSNMFPQG